MNAPKQSYLERRAGVVRQCCVFLAACGVGLGAGLSPPSAVYAAGGDPLNQSTPMPNIPRESDATGLGCSYFTRPSVERNNTLGVSAVRLNSYAEASVVCHGPNRYQCINKRWKRIGTDCADSDPKQSWRVEGTEDPGPTNPSGQPGSTGGVGEGSGEPAGGGGEPSGAHGGASGPPGPYDSGTPFGGESGVSSPFDAPFGATPLQGGYGALGQPSPVNGGRQPPSSQPNDGRASPASGDIVISRECLQQQTASSREWQARCENVADAQGMCATYRGLAKCMEDGIRRVRNLPCPREMLDSSIAAMQDVIDQAKANARQVCAN